MTGGNGQEKLNVHKHAVLNPLILENGYLDVVSMGLTAYNRMMN